MRRKMNSASASLRQAQADKYLTIYLTGNFSFIEKLFFYPFKVYNETFFCRTVDVACNW
jgi:hypothetical protein